MERVQLLLHVLYIKWIKGECRHLCCMCSYYNECWDNINWKE